MKRFVAWVFTLALIGSSTAQAAPPEESKGNQADKAIPSTEPSTTGQKSISQGGDAQAPDALSQTDALNQLLENELSSVQTYERALEKFRPEGDHETFDIYKELMTIHQDHQHAVVELKTQVQQVGGTPITAPGVGGIWAKMIMEGAALLGNKTALETLKHGEENSTKEYQQILQHQNIPSQTSSWIQTILLPRQHAHVAQLDSLIQEVEKLEAMAEKAEEKAKEAEKQEQANK